MWNMYNETVCNMCPVLCQKWQNKDVQSFNSYPCSREGFYSLKDKTDVLSPDLVKPRWREIKCYHGRIIIKFVRHFYNATAEMRVKFQSAWKSLNPNLAALRLNEILR